MFSKIGKMSVVPEFDSKLEKISQKFYLGSCYYPVPKGEHDDWVFNTIRRAFVDDGLWSCYCRERCWQTTVSCTSFVDRHRLQRIVRNLESTLRRQLGCEVKRRYAKWMEDPNHEFGVVQYICEMERPVQMREPDKPSRDPEAWRPFSVTEFEEMKEMFQRMALMRVNI